jgi:hypothetical protein
MIHPRKGAISQEGFGKAMNILHAVEVILFFLNPNRRGCKYKNTG